MRVKVGVGKSRHTGRRIQQAILVAALSGMAIGAGVVLLARSPARRQRAAGALRRTMKRSVRLARHLVAEGYGLGERLVHALPAEPVDERTLLDRVESRLFAIHGVPKERLTLDVEKGVVVLRGQLDTDEQIDRVVHEVSRIPGVERLESLLHLPGTPAPNKELVLNAQRDPRGRAS